MRKIITILILSLCIFQNVLVSHARLERADAYTIDSTMNASHHNNLGLLLLEENQYYAAIEEFNIAIKLNPNTQATAVYYNNLGETYLKMGAADWAQTCFENAIKQYNLNFLFYQNLVKCFKAKGILNQKINEYKVKSTQNNLSSVILGLCYVENGQIRNGIITLDAFCMSEPRLILSYSIQNYIQELAKQIK